MALSLSIRLGLASNSGVSILGSAQVGDTLSLSALYLTGASPITYSVQWERNGTNIAGATSASYTTQAADVGTSVSATVTLPGGSTLASVNAVSVLAAPSLSDPNVQAVQSNGWEITYAAANMPAEFSVTTGVKYLQVTRPGYDAAGAPTTVVDDVPITKRLRVPGTTGLSTDRAALARPVYVGDTIPGGITNASTAVYPRPVCQWLTPDHLVLRQGDTNVPARLEVSHPFGRNGRPVAAVRFSLSDGVTTNHQTVTSMASRQWSASGLYAAYYEANLVTLAVGLNTGAELTLDFEVRPWAGNAFVASVHGNPWPSNKITTRRVWNDLAGTYGRPLAYVDATAGNNGTAVVSETAATAAAAPYATIDAAAAALVAWNTTNKGRANLSGGEIALAAGTHTMTTSIGTLAVAETPLVIRAVNAAAQATTILQDRGTTMFVGFPGRIILRDLTLRRTASGNEVFLDNGAGSIASGGLSYWLEIDNCAFDLNGQTAYAGWLYRSGRGFLHNCTGLNAVLTSQRASLAKSYNAVGCLGSGSFGASVYNASACKSVGENSGINTMAATTGAEAGDERSFFFNHITTTTNGGTAVGLHDVTSINGAAVIMSVLEQTTGATSSLLAVHADGNVTPTPNIQAYGLTVVGARSNWLYQDAGTARIDKVGSMFACVHYSRNTKTDLFAPINANRIGNWGVRYQVNMGYNCALAGDDGASSGNRWLGEFPALGDDSGTSGSVMNPLWTNDGSFYGSGAGAGDYRPLAGTPLPRVPSAYVHYPIDMTGKAIPLDGSAVAGALQIA